LPSWAFATNPLLGLIEIEQADDDYLNRNIRIRSRPLLKQLVQFWPHQPDTDKLH
jgi:hypothetical protein